MKTHKDALGQELKVGDKVTEMNNMIICELYPDGYVLIDDLDKDDHFEAYLISSTRTIKPNSLFTREQVVELIKEVVHHCSVLDHTTGSRRILTKDFPDKLIDHYLKSNP